MTKQNENNKILKSREMNSKNKKNKTGENDRKKAEENPDENNGIY